MAAPTVRILKEAQGSVAFMAPHGCWFYLDLDNSATGDSGDWHECSIRWSVLVSDGTPIDNDIKVYDPRPFIEDAGANVSSCQRGFVCWFLLETAATYRVTCTITNKSGLSTSGSTGSVNQPIDVVVVSDTRTYYYLDGGALTNGAGTSDTVPFNSFASAISAMGSTDSRGLRIKSGSLTLVSAGWLMAHNLSNIVVETYGGTEQARLRSTKTTSNNDYFFQTQSASKHLLFRNLKFESPVSFLNAGPAGVSIGGTGSNVSVVNCTGFQCGTPFGGTATKDSAGGKGFALVNCTSDLSATNGAYIDGFYSVVVLGWRTLNNQFSHVVRVIAENAAAARCSVGYSDLDGNCQPSRTDTDSRTSFRNGTPQMWCYHTYSRGGTFSIENGHATIADSYRVVERSYLANGAQICIGLDETMDRVRFSGVIWEVENRKLSGECPRANDEGYPVLDMNGDVSYLVIEGVTVLLKDFWTNTGSDILIESKHKVTDGFPTFLGCTVKNMLVAYNTDKTTLGNHKLLSIPSVGLLFSGNVWPDLPNDLFTVGTTGATTPTNDYTVAEWIANAAGIVTGDKAESVDWEVLKGQKFRPNRVVQPKAASSSVAANPAYTDYYGRAFDAAGGRVGAVAGPKTLARASGIPL